MGWYESNVYQSAFSQILVTVEAILKDPYLMPPSPLFGPVFDILASADSEVRETAGLQSITRLHRNLTPGSFFPSRLAAPARTPKENTGYTVTR
jgi:hypothetical protein